MTEVILKREVPRLGDRGDVVRVAAGFARNYLFPQQLAIPATAASKKNIKDMKASAERESARLKGDAEKLAALLQDLTIKIVARAGESNQLFGSVTSRDIAAEIEKQGYQIDRHKIFLAKPIRLVGDHETTIHLHRDIDLKLLVKVRAEGREDEEFVAGETAEAEAATETAEAEAAAEETVAEVAEAAADEAEPANAEAVSGKASGAAAKKSGKRSKKAEDEE